MTPKAKRDWVGLVVFLTPAFLEKLNISTGSMFFVENTTFGSLKLRSLDNPRLTIHRVDREDVEIIDHVYNHDRLKWNEACWTEGAFKSSVWQEPQIPSPIPQDYGL